MSDFKPSNVRRALLVDAVAQVLDNRVFRILSVLSALMVALTFAVGFREDSIWLLGGWREFFYQDLFDFFDIPLPLGGANQQEAVIGFLQRLFVDYFAGYIGILFCIGATAFFVPAMLEKGFADTFFSKPVSRFSLLFSRYVASILFITFLALFLVGGIHLGLTISSGYSDPTFLWSAITLVYLFALVASFSILFGTLTRSTVAALLLTFTAYGITTGIHNAWIPLQYAKDNGFLDENERARQEERSNEIADAFLDGLQLTVEGLHYVLPKTADAKFITANLRDQIVIEDNSARSDGDRDAPEDGITVTLGDDPDDDRESRGGRRRGRQVAENPWAYYERQLGWSSELRYNLTFSIASSLAWIGAALGLAWLRLRRISF